MVWTIVGLIYMWTHYINNQHHSYTYECMISIMNINNGIKESRCAYQNYNTSQIFIFGGYIKVRKYLYTLVIIWVNTILNHIDTKKIVPR